MFVTVRYGEDERRIFNINCRNEVLLHQIKKKCKVDREEVIELSDEHGTVKNLRQNLDEYGYEYLKERETVILLKVETCVQEPTPPPPPPPGSDDKTEPPPPEVLPDKTTFIPLLVAMSENQEFIDSLNPKDRLSKASVFDDPDGKGKKAKSKDKKKDKDKKNKPAQPKK
ncbi:uncharacterized protein LOC127870833 [Dreissena polymorpha]|uniref:Uncharacterized protein n=1 Tax=Dreissena polymorpha TaxID=45954 RepID=A0A9D4R5Q4_DREPO|nr:uncharacterized protein LOC127870833 [Dreissena polymorpha]KAH3854852.1 hypothetical protein DPMN_097410 [Dreissena polymorpha]